MENIIDYEAIEKLAESIREFAYRLGEILGEIAEKIGEFLDDFTETKKPKYKFIKNLIKPYKQPFIKVRYRARANL